MVQIWTFWIYSSKIQALNQFRKIIDVSLNLQKLESCQFLIIFSRNRHFMKRIRRADTYHTVYIISFINCKKVSNSYSILFGEKVLSPPPYVTRPLCIVCFEKKKMKTVLVVKKISYLLNIVYTTFGRSSKCQQQY